MALGTLSTAAGYNATASGSHSTAVGHTTVSTSFAEMAIGRFNEITSTAPSAGPDGVDGQHTWRDADAVFRVGVGSDESNRQDALTVYKDGRVTIPGLEMNKTAALEAALSDEKNKTATLEQKVATLEQKVARLETLFL